MNRDHAENLPPTLVVGLGVTGLSVARYLAARGVAYALTDTRPNPPALADLADQGLDADCWQGPLHALAAPERWRCWVVSPGVPVRTPAVAAAAAAGVAVIGDIELFARASTRPCVALTGSNGKSTVATLAALLLNAAGVRAAAGANLGPPALDLLAVNAEVDVLELSSFQLETTHSLCAASAAILNISPDHLDRYPDMAAYVAAKARILQGAKRVVLNRDDPVLIDLAATLVTSPVTFGTDAPTRTGDFGLRAQGDTIWLVRGSEALLPGPELRLQGRHNWLNVLSALALVWPWLEGVGTPGQLFHANHPVGRALREFTGLAHRSQPVVQHRGVWYVNDSKGTNVGATLAALRGVPGPLVLIAGGQGKGQDFAPLAAALDARVRGVVLLGSDAPILAEALQGRVPTRQVADMTAAVAQAAAWAQPGDTVLLSPACASLDMFRGYADRGDCFAAAACELAEAP